MLLQRSWDLDCQCSLGVGPIVFQPRLAEELAAATFSQLQLKIESDLDNLTEHFTCLQAEASRQAHLTDKSCESENMFNGPARPLSAICLNLCQAKMDVKYLKNRYDRGVKEVQTFMGDNQRYVHVPSLQDALPDFLECVSKVQAKTGKPVHLRCNGRKLCFFQL